MFDSIPPNRTPAFEKLLKEIQEDEARDGIIPPFDEWHVTWPSAEEVS
jgi:hypothetical protein